MYYYYYYYYHYIVCFSLSLAVFSTPSFCLLSIEEGPCHATKRRFAYNPLTQKCSIFPYGGCEGNKNNFVYKRQCMKICMNVHRKCYTALLLVVDKVYWIIYIFICLQIFNIH